MQGRAIRPERVLFRYGTRDFLPLIAKTSLFVTSFLINVVRADMASTAGTRAARRLEAGQFLAEPPQPAGGRVVAAGR
jgi:hypothetical protein